MEAFVVFDTYVDSYQVSSRIGEFESIDGVRNAEALERVAGEVPRYCLTFDIDDDRAQEAGWGKSPIPLFLLKLFPKA